MNGLKIRSYDQWSFSFRADDYGGIPVGFQSCDYCRVTALDRVYVYIINSLKEAGLLDENYKLICCFCAVLKEFGLLDIKDRLNRIIYDDILDTLIIRFMFRDSEIRDSESYVCFYVHGYLKINHWN